MKPTDIINGLFKGRFASVAAALAAGLLVSACAMDRPSDPRQAFPITVSTETPRQSFGLSEKGLPASTEEAFALRRFVRDYLNRGRTSLTVSVGGSNELAALQMTDYITKLGVPSGSLNVRYDGAEANEVELSFTGYTADVPECGDWSKSELFNWDNSRSPNFGCAMRRNIGLMVTDPGDLIRSKPASGHSAARGANAIDTYNAPPVAGTAGAAGAAGAAAGVAGATSTGSTTK